MEQIVATIVNIFVLSSVYILVAIGFSFLFNVLNVFNLAHGAIYMLGAYVSYEVASVLGLGPWVGLLAATFTLALFGIFSERVFFRPFMGDLNSTIIVSIAIILILQTAVNIAMGDKILALPPFLTGVLKTGLVSITWHRVMTFIMGIVLLVMTLWFVNRTRWGLQMQAIAQDLEGAALQGIDVRRISIIACVVAFSLAAIAGCLMGAYLSLTPFMGDYILSKVLILVILAGVGSISGVFYTGLILGAMDSTMPLLIGGAASEAVTITVVIIIFLFLPKGFFGHEA